MRPEDVRALQDAAQKGRTLLKEMSGWEWDDLNPVLYMRGIKGWYVETEQLLEEMFGRTEFWEELQKTGATGRCSSSTSDR